MKIIPINIIEFLSPLALAIWFMSDGHAGNVSVYISAARYTKAECELLIDALIKKLGLVVTCGEPDGYPVLYIPAESYDLFYSLVNPHLLPEFRYKLDPHYYRDKLSR